MRDYHEKENTKYYNKNTMEKDVISFFHQNYSSITCTEHTASRGVYSSIDPEIMSTFHKASFVCTHKGSHTQNPLVDCSFMVHSKNNKIQQIDILIEKENKKLSGFFFNYCIDFEEEIANTATKEVEYQIGKYIIEKSGINLMPPAPK